MTSPHSRRKGDSTGARMLPNPQQQTSLPLPRGRIVYKARRGAQISPAVVSSILASNAPASSAQASSAPSIAALGKLNPLIQEQYISFIEHLDKMRSVEVKAAEPVIMANKSLSNVARKKLEIAFAKRLTRPDVVDQPPPEPLPVDNAPVVVQLATDLPVEERRPGVVTPEAAASWAKLRDEAKTLPVLKAGDMPRSMPKHMRYRVGEIQHGTRPHVRVRKIVDGKISYVEVTDENHLHVLRAVEEGTWTGLSKPDRAKLETLAKEWKPLPPNPVRRDQMVDTWLRTLEVDQDDQSNPDKIESYRKTMTQAADAIISWVEPEVLNMIGLPKIFIHKGGGKTQQHEPAYYTGEKQEVHFQTDVQFTPERLAHEFGHHIEEQGAAEVWCGMAAFLGSLGPGKELVNYVKDVAKNYPSGYPAEWFTRPPRLPNAVYAVTYYQDGATELVALGLEQGILDQPATKVDFHDDEPAWKFDSQRYAAEYMALMMQAARPNQVRNAGVTFPTLGHELWVA
jgi:hypothetical protein